MIRLSYFFRKENFIWLIISMLFLTACDNKEKQYYSNGAIKEERITQIKGYEKIIRYNRNGSKWQVREYKNGKIISDKYYYDNGLLSCEFPYLKGNKHGIAKRYNSNGELEAEIEFKNDHRNGKTTCYYKNGKKFIIAYYDSFQCYEGYLHGKFIVFDKNENILASGTFKNGKPFDGSFISSSEKNIYFSKTGLFIHYYKSGKSIKIDKLEKPINDMPLL